MIPRPHIAAWQAHAPWKSFSQKKYKLFIGRKLSSAKKLLFTVEKTNLLER